MRTWEKQAKYKLGSLEVLSFFQSIDFAYSSPISEIFITSVQEIEPKLQNRKSSIISRHNILELLYIYEETC